MPTLQDRIAAFFADPLADLAAGPGSGGWWRRLTLRRSVDR